MGGVVQMHQRRVRGLDDHRLEDRVQRIGHLLALIEDRRGRHMPAEEPLHALLAVERAAREVLVDRHDRAGRVPVQLLRRSIGKDVRRQRRTEHLAAAVAAQSLGHMLLGTERGVTDNAQELTGRVLVDLPEVASRARVPLANAAHPMVDRARLHRRCLGPVPA